MTVSDELPPDSLAYGYDGQSMPASIQEKLNKVRPASPDSRMSSGSETSKETSKESSKACREEMVPVSIAGRRSSAEVMVESMRQRERSQSSLCLPNSSRLNRWDAVVAVALAFTGGTLSSPSR
jgi:hypothetical protein